MAENSWDEEITALSPYVLHRAVIIKILQECWELTELLFMDRDECVENHGGCSRKPAAEMFRTSGAVPESKSLLFTFQIYDCAYTSGSRRGVNDIARRVPNV